MERKEYRTDLSREKGPPAESPFIEKSGKVHSGAGPVTVHQNTVGHAGQRYGQISGRQMSSSRVEPRKYSSLYPLGYRDFLFIRKIYLELR